MIIVEQHSADELLQLFRQDAMRDEVRQGVVLEQLQQRVTSQATQVLATQMYTEAFTNYKLGYGAAVGGTVGAGVILLSLLMAAGLQGAASRKGAGASKRWVPQQLPVEVPRPSRWRTSRRGSRNW